MAKLPEYVYVVYYLYGYYDEEQTIIVFATFDENKASGYCDKFNKKLASWKAHWDEYYVKPKRPYLVYNTRKVYRIINAQFCKYEAVKVKIWTENHK